MSGSTGAGGSNARKSISLDGHKHRRTEVRKNGNTDIARRLSNLYDALLAARASDLKVRKAAEEAAAYGQRFHPLERQLEDVTGKQRLQRWMLSIAFVLLLGETGKEGRRIGSFRLTSLVRSRQDTDRSVLKTEHPEVYASVLKVIAWEQLAVEYVPAEAVTPPVPQMWHPPALEPSDPDVPF